METGIHTSSIVERALVSLGMLLIVLLSCACDYLLSRSGKTLDKTLFDRVIRSLGLLVVGLVTTIGWTVDRLALVSASFEHQRTAEI
jgi:hypothetical protein